MERRESADSRIERGSYIIALDSKARLVLPLEIREALNIETNGKILITVISTSSQLATRYGRDSVSTANKTQDTGRETVTILLAKASDSDMANGRKFSRNCAYLKDKWRREK